MVVNGGGSTEPTWNGEHESKYLVHNGRMHPPDPIIELDQRESSPESRSQQEGMKSFEFREGLLEVGGLVEQGKT